MTYRMTKNAIIENNKRMEIDYTTSKLIQLGEMILHVINYENHIQLILF